MNNNDCGCMGSGYTFGNGSNSYNYSRYSGSYGVCEGDGDSGYENFGGYENYNGGYDNYNGGYEQNNSCGCGKHKCAYVRDDDCECEKHDCGCNHSKHDWDCGKRKDDCGCGQKHKDDCGCCFKICIPSFPFRCR